MTILWFNTVDRYAIFCLVLVIIAIVILGPGITYMDVTSYIILGLELPSSSTVGTFTFITKDLPGESVMSTSPNLSQTGNVTNNTAFNDTNLNSNLTNKSSSPNSNLTNKSSLNTTIPEQLPPESINGSRTGKI